MAMEPELSVKGNKNPYLELINKGINFYKSNQFEKAIKQFNQVIKNHPDYPESYYYRGSCYYKKSTFSITNQDISIYLQRALRDLSKYIHLASEDEVNISAEILRAKILRLTNDYDTAITNLNKIIIKLITGYFHNTDKFLYESYLEQGLSYYELAKKNRLITYYQLALDTFNVADTKKIDVEKNLENQANLYSYRGHTLLALSLEEKDSEKIKELVYQASQDYENAIKLISLITNEQTKSRFMHYVFINLSIEKELITNAICHLPKEQRIALINTCLDDTNRGDQHPIKQILWYQRNDSPCSKSKGNLKRMVVELNKCKETKHKKRLTLFTRPTQAKGDISQEMSNLTSKI